MVNKPIWRVLNPELTMVNVTSFEWGTRPSSCPSQMVSSGPNRWVHRPRLDPLMTQPTWRETSNPVKNNHGISDVDDHTSG